VNKTIIFERLFYDMERNTFKEIILIFMIVHDEKREKNIDF
jgi:hypothetical protein